VLRTLMIAATIIVQSESFVLAAPRQLYGKSIVVSWQEERLQRRDGDDQPVSMSASGTLQVYISDQGRPFSRLTMGIITRRGKFKSGNADAVDGAGSREGGKTFARNISFGGQSMAITQPRGAGGAMRVLVDFDRGFENCTAHILIGKGSGQAMMKTHSLATGKRVDIYSAKASAETCQTHVGNLFLN
jgi:hypothetical protein